MYTCRVPAPIDKAALAKRLRIALVATENTDQRAFAEKCGVPEQSLSNILGAHRPEKRYLSKIAAGLRVGLGWLMYGDSPEPEWIENPGIIVERAEKIIKLNSKNNRKETALQIVEAIQHAMDKEVSGISASFSLEERNTIDDALRIMLEVASINEDDKTKIIALRNKIEKLEAPFHMDRTNTILDWANEELAKLKNILIE